MSPYRKSARPDGPPNVLVCAGLDPSGGAGLIADVRVATLLGVRPVGVVTALTVQDTNGVRSYHPLDPEVIQEQLEALLSDIEVMAIKIGMIGSPEIARTLGKALDLTNAELVWDPVRGSTNGAPLAWMAGSKRETFAALEPLVRHVRLVTPNVSEMSWLADREIESADEAIAAAQAVARELGIVVLVKGGHLQTGDNANDCDDIFVDEDSYKLITGPRVVHGENVHGTGCALSTAIAAELAKGQALLDACRAAKQFVHERIANPVVPGRGAPAVV